MPFSFVSDHIKSTDGYKNWMQPLTQSSEQKSSDETRARLITSLGQNSDLIELNLETSSMMFFRQTHALRMIRSIFPLDGRTEGEEENKEGKDELDGGYTDSQSSVIGFKLAKTTNDCQSIQIYLTPIEMDEDNDEGEQLL